MNHLLGILHKKKHFEFEILNAVMSLVYTAFFLAYFYQVCDGQNAYIYYTDASCSNSQTISGTFNLAYDDESLSGFGFSSENYEGECIYFDGGSMDISYYSSAYDLMKEGYCVTCEGVTSCSSDETCDNAVSLYSSNLYHLTEESANAYKKEEVSPQAFKNAEELDNVAMKMVSNSQLGSSAIYASIGFFIGLVSWFSLLIGLEGHRQWRMKRQNKELAESLAAQV